LGVTEYNTKYSTSDANIPIGIFGIQTSDIKECSDFDGTEFTQENKIELRFYIN
jgi:hypothetical protein